MKIIFFYRNHKVGYSIGKVFDSILEQFPDKKRIEVPCHNSSLLAIAKNMACVFTHRDRNLVNHVTGDIHYVLPALLGCKTVLTIHDTSCYDCCHSQIKKWIVKLLWLTIPLKIATKVVCISEETRRCVKRFTRRDDLIVIYNPVDDSFITCRKEMDANCPKFLIIGTAWNKNIVNTLKALDGIKGEVTIVGTLSENQKKVASGLKQMKVRTLPGLTDQALLEEYKNCDIVLFCTIFEGFGMPIIEGQKIGRAIITSNIEPHKEIAGDGALFVDPHSVEDIRKAVLSVVNDDDLYNKLVDKGLENVKRFDVRRIASEYTRIYSEIL